MADNGRATRVVVADDEPDLRDVLATLLRRHGFDVVGAAANGHDAVRLVREMDPAVVVLDVSMPGLNGIDALKAIRQERPSTRVVVWAADLHGREQAMAAGAHAWVTKGGGVSEIVEAVRNG